MRTLPAILILLLVGCGPSPTKELERVANPSASLQAVHGERQTGATVATPTVVHLVPFGEALNKEPVFLADHVEGLELEWTSDTELELRAKRARVFKSESEAEVEGTTVTLHFGIEVAEPI